jgi:hypothetical protein
MPDESSAKNRFLHAGQGAENANEKSRQYIAGTVVSRLSTQLEPVRFVRT